MNTPTATDGLIGYAIRRLFEVHNVTQLSVKTVSGRHVATVGLRGEGETLFAALQDVGRRLR